MQMEGRTLGNTKDCAYAKCHMVKFVISKRSVDKWNNLSDNCVSCTMLNNFKSHMRLHWDWKPDSIVRL